MLLLPDKGLNRSVYSHNYNIEVLCDWIETNLVFTTSEISVIEFAEYLISEEVYASQDFAREGVRNAIEELKRRISLINGEDFYQFDGDLVIPNICYETHPVYAFLLLLALAPKYSWWSREFGQDYTEQGDLFELITKFSVEQQFNNYFVHQTGWTRENPNNLENVVNDITNLLNESLGSFDVWNDPYANELGLDLLCFRKFSDNRKGIPVYLIQCASGNNWKDKLTTPDLNVWKDIIHFSVLPSRAFSTPFTFSEIDFHKNSVKVQGVFLDRIRLLEANRYNQNWVPPELNERVLQWIEPRLETLIEKSG
jgi:hypothetical protein